MENSHSGWPEKFHLFPRLERIGGFIKRLVSFVPVEAPPYMSEHYRGGAAMLDRELYEQPELPLEYKLGHAVMHGELSAEQAYEELGHGETC